MIHTAYAVLFGAVALARAFYSLICELFNCEAMGIFDLTKYPKKRKIIIMSPKTVNKLLSSTQKMPMVIYTPPPIR